MWTAVPAIYNVFTAPQIRASLFNWTYVRCCWRYINNSLCVILQTWCQIQRTSSSLRYLNCGPGHIQRNYSSAYSGVNIQLSVSALPLLIYRQFSVRYTTNMVPNTAHIFKFTLYELWSRTYTMNLQLLIFRLQYSTERISAAIGDLSGTQCALYCKLCAEYSAHRPDYAIWFVVPHIYNELTAPYIQAAIFDWTYLRWYWRYLDNSVFVILQT
jgi:hypothetical protein